MFTWEAKHENMSWWAHVADEMPALAALGVSQLWLPPPNKAMRPVSSALMMCMCAHADHRRAKAMTHMISCVRCVLMCTGGTEHLP
jgi:hypothetical protein